MEFSPARGSPPSAGGILHAAGSLRFAAVLLSLLLVGMACATVYESSHGAEQALTLFYRSWWFKTLLGLVGVNVLASVLVRYPFSRRQVGFVVTHTGILVTLGGAAVTELFGLAGNVGFFEGQTVDSFTGDVDTLTLVSQRDPQRASVDLTARAFRAFEEVERPGAPTLRLGAISVEVERFLPDSEWVRRVLDDHPSHQPAMEVSLSATGQDNPTWVFAGRTESLGPVEIAYRVARTDEELTRLLDPPTEKAPGGKGLVKIEYAGAKFDIPLDQAMQQAVPLGDTGLTAHVLRYLPHAIVGEDKQLVNVSDQPVNPAIEVEMVGPSGSQKRLAFAKFADFQSMHGKPQLEGLKVNFVAPVESSPGVGVEVISGRDGELYARLRPGGAEARVRKLEVGVPVDSPWAGQRFAVLRRFEHARVDWTAGPVKPIRKDRKPALLLKVSTPAQTNQVWVQKHGPRPLTIDGVPYQLSYEGKEVPLGFQLRLDRFQMGYYPGGMRPRSFESHVTITDAATGLTQSRVVSMNHPVKYGGFSLYQASYQQEAGRSASVLSVARDPGQPIVFAGYIIMLLGMVVVLGTRVADRRNLERLRKE